MEHKHTQTILDVLNCTIAALTYVQLLFPLLYLARDDCISQVEIQKEKDEAQVVLTKSTIETFNKTLNLSLCAATWCWMYKKATDVSVSPSVLHTTQYICCLL